MSTSSRRTWLLVLGTMAVVTPAALVMGVSDAHLPLPGRPSSRPVTPQVAAKPVPVPSAAARVETAAVAAPGTTAAPTPVAAGPGATGTAEPGTGHIAGSTEPPATSPAPTSLVPPSGPPVPPGLAAQFDALDQQRTYLEQLKRLAVAKRQLCDTGFGPSDLCSSRERTPAGGTPSGRGNAAADAAPQSRETKAIPPAALLAVDRITGAAGATRAVLVIGSTGERVLVDARTMTKAALPGGVKVVLIDPAQQRVDIVDAGGHRETLPWIGGVR